MTVAHLHARDALFCGSRNFFLKKLQKGERNSRSLLQQQTKDHPTTQEKSMPPVFKHDDFVVAITCMDGRIQSAVLAFIKSRYGSSFVDLVTDIGPNKLLAVRKANFRHGKKTFLDSVWAMFVIKSIRERLKVSVHNHHAKMFFIVAHEHCAGNPAHKEDQLVHLREAQKTVALFGFKKEIKLLWVQNDWKTVEEVE